MSQILKYNSILRTVLSVDILRIELGWELKINEYISWYLFMGLCSPSSFSLLRKLVTLERKRMFLCFALFLLMFFSSCTQHD